MMVPSSCIASRSVNFQFLAIAYLQANKLDDSLSQVEKAVLADPQNARAWHMQGKAWMIKGNYQSAADSLSRALALEKPKNMEAAYSLGICYLHLHKKEDAARVFKEMEAPAIDRGRLHVLFARAYRDADYMDDAVRELKAALAINPKTPHAHYLLGLVGLLQSEWAPRPEIRQQFLLELQLNPRDFLTNYLLGAMESTAKNLKESDHYLAIATQIDPSWPEPWTYLGLNANSEGNLPRAEEQLKKAIALTGTDYVRSNYLIRKAYFALGRIQSSAGRKEEAEGNLKIAADLVQRVRDQGRREMEAYQSPDKVQAENVDDSSSPAMTPEDIATVDPTAKLDSAALANLPAEQKEAALAQEKRLRAVLAASFNDLATSEAIGQKYTLALDHYQEAERWDSQFPGLMRNLGMAAAHAQNYSEAARALAPVLAANPQDNTVRAMLGMSYYMTDQYAPAANTIAPLGDAVYKDPGLAYAWAESLAKQDKLQEASAVLDRMEQQPLANETAMLVGRLWDQIGNHTRAVQTLHGISERSPSWPKAHYYAGLACIHANQPAEAAAEFQSELQITPDDPEAKYNLGFVNLQLSKRDEAMALFQSVIAAHPDYAPAQYQLGKLLLDDGKVKDAITHLEIAVRLSPQTDYMHYQLQAAYRIDSRIQDADRELAIYKEVKARNRGRIRQGMGEN